MPSTQDSQKPLFSRGRNRNRNRFPAVVPRCNSSFQQKKIQYIFQGFAISARQYLYRTKNRDHTHNNRRPESREPRDQRPETRDQDDRMAHVTERNGRTRARNDTTRHDTTRHGTGPTRTGPTKERERGARGGREREGERDGT